MVAGIITLQPEWDKHGNGSVRKSGARDIILNVPGINFYAFFDKMLGDRVSQEDIMPTEVRRVQGEPIVIVRFGDDQEPTAQIVKQAAQQVLDLTADVTGTIYRIIDFTGPEEVSFSDLIEGMAADLLDSPIAREPRVKTYIVGEGPLHEIVVEGIQQPQYGSLPVYEAPTVELALAAIRQEIAQNTVKE